MSHLSTIRRAEMVRQIVQEHYEPGRQDRCKLWVFRKFIAKQFGICQRTFFYYLSLVNAGAQQDALQLSLW